MSYKTFIFGILFAWLCFVPVMADEQSQTESDQFRPDPEITNIDNTLEILGWCNLTEISNATTPNENDEESDLSSKQIQYIQLCQHMKTIKTLESELSSNTAALEENYQAMQDKETSFENRMLGAGGIGTVGIGGMMAASALSEQNADKNADADMQAYLSTFSCTYPGGNAKGGQTGIELPGANQLIGLYTQYVDLANDLKERKTALGLTPGIESEVILDKANMNLYDNDSNGIENGTFASLYRASKGNTQDINKINEQKESTSKQLKIGAGVAAAGAIATTAANYAINHNNKDKSAELLAQRAEIKDKFDTLINQIITDCNKNIADAKANIPTEDEFIIENTSDGEPQTYQEFVNMINSMQPLQNASEINRIKDIPVCAQ